MRTRRYSELNRLSTFLDRYEYLVLKGVVGSATFGFDRWINQQFYRSKEWRNARQYVVARDLGCDLGAAGRESTGPLLIHHMNPITPDDIRDGNDWILDPEYLITTTHQTHNAIHYGDASLLPKLYVARRAGDTKLW